MNVLIQTDECNKFSMEGINERIALLVNELGMNKNSFSKKIGLANNTVLENIVGRRQSKPGFEVLNKIILSIENVSSRWLMTGEGEMLLSGEEKALKQLTPCVSPELGLGVPYYDVDFSGGFNAIFNNQTLLPDHNIVFAPFKDAQLWCNVTGNSMAEKINHGDIIALKELPNWEENVLFGEIYAVVTEHLRTIKIIRKSDNKDTFKLVPINTLDFDENEVKKTSILRVFEVLGAIKKFF